MALLSRIVSFLRRRGPRAAAALVADHARRRVWIDESHVWYVLDLTAPRPRRELPEDLTLRRDDREHVDRLADLETLGPDAARRRLDDGARLWLALDAEGAGAFACWNFFGAAPVFAARGGALRLPQGVVVLEDSVTSPAQRGRGVAPAVWAIVGDTLASEGHEHLITKIERVNVASRRAIVKAGFRAFAIDEHVRRGPRHEVRVWTDGSGLGDALVDGLGARVAGTAPPEPFDAPPVPAAPLAA